MGIDIYMVWDNQTQEEHEAQLTGFSTVHGHVGYLREAYHGGPYATQLLFPEAFVGGSEGAVIASSLLRERMTKVPVEPSPEVLTGHNTAVLVMESMKSMGFDRVDPPTIKPATLESMTVEEAIIERSMRVYGEDENSQETQEILKSFRDFVSLYETLETQGKNPRIIASY